MTRNGGARLLADTIEGILNHGVGPMNIPYDDLRVALHQKHGLGLNETQAFLKRHLLTALDYLADNGWSSVKTTDEWFAFGYVEPPTEVELKHCIAGLGRLSDGSPSIGVGLHFCLGTDDMLFIYARNHGARVWRGKRHKEVDRIAIEVDAGRMTESGLKVADHAGREPVIGDKAYKEDMKQIKANLP